MFEEVKNMLSLYGTINEDDWVYFTTLMKVENAPKNTLLLRNGEVCNKAFFVKKGAVRLYYINEEGNEICGNFFFENELCSSFESFISRKPGKQILETLEDCEFFSISYEELNRAFDERPVFSKVFLRLLERRFIYTQKLISLYILTNPKERYKYLLENFPEIIKRVSQKHIASFLGISPFTLSRIRNKMKIKG